MILGFGEALFILALVGSAFISLLLVAFSLYVIIRRKKIPLLFWVGIIGLTPFSFLALRSMMAGDIDYNPSGITKERISGVYIKGNKLIKLNSDGSYSSENLDYIPASGNWSYYDWNLKLSGAKLDKPRWIIRNQIPEILPYYSGADGPDGVALQKKN